MFYNIYLVTSSTGGRTPRCGRTESSQSYRRDTYGCTGDDGEISLSENRDRLAYILQNGGKFVVSPGGLHIIVSLQSKPYCRGNPCCGLYFQCRISGYRTFTVNYLVECSVRHAYYPGKFSLRHSTCLQFILEHFSRMYSHRTNQLVGGVDFLCCCFHIALIYNGY